MRILSLICSISLLGLACDDGGGGEDSAGGCNPACSPGFVCNDERICVADTDGTVDEDDGGPDEEDPDDGVTPPEDDMGEPMECEHQCSPGELRCSGDAVEACGANAQGCFRWNEAVPCAAGLSCSNGECSATCEDECALGDQECGAVGVRTCVTDADGDECTDWAPEVACEEGESCSNGACQAGPCDDECGIGALRCAADGTGFEACGEHDADDCLEWGAAVDCAEGETCSNGECSLPEQCQDECAEGVAQCTDGNLARIECGQFDADPCSDLGQPERCDEGDLCSGGVCRAVEQCEDECAAEARRCVANGFQVCTEVEGCMLWGEQRACPEAQGCVDGQCVDDPVDECPGEDAVRCDGNAVLTCGNFDADPTLEWSPPQACEAGQSCSNGVCADVEMCEDECEMGAVRCQGGGTQLCGEGDADDCLDWEAVTPCLAGDACSDGACRAIENCQDECDIGVAECVMGGVRSCGDFDADDCNDWSAPVACPAEQICLGGGCMAQPDDANAMIDFFAPAADELVWDSVRVTVSAQDPQGVESLRITAGEQVILEADSAGVVNADWDTTQAPDGPIEILATVVDPLGSETFATRSVVVDNSPPAVDIESPDADAVLIAPFDFEAAINDPGGVAEVRFFVDNQEVAVLDEEPWTVNVDPLDFEPAGPKTIEVVARDVAGHETRLSRDVTFSPENLAIAIRSPEIGSVAARPFTFAVDVNGPDGVDEVVLFIDDEELARFDAPPFEVEVDPALYEVGDHQLSVSASDATGRMAQASLGLDWDEEAPIVELANPEAGGIVPREDGNFIVTVEVEDADAAPTVELFVGELPAAEDTEPPYALAFPVGDFQPDAHETEVQIRVVVTDYLGNTGQLAVPLRLSRAELGIQVRGSSVSTLRLAPDGRAIAAMWNPILELGRLIVLGPDGIAPIYDVDLPGHRVIEAAFYPGGDSVGLQTESPLGDRTFLRIDADGTEAWRYEAASIDSAQIVGGTTLIVADGMGLGFDAAGNEAFRLVPDAERVEQLVPMNNGDVLAGSTRVDGMADFLRRHDSNGEEVWERVLGGRLRRVIVEQGIILWRRDDASEPHEVVAVERLDGGDGVPMWTSLLEDDLLLQSSGLRTDGAPYANAQNLHVFQAHAIAWDPANGDELFAFSPPGFPLTQVIAGRNRDLIVSAQDERMGEGGAAIFHLGADGMVRNQYLTDDESIDGMKAGEGFTVATTTDALTGQSAAIVVDEDGEEVWNWPLPAGYSAAGFSVPFARALDVSAFNGVTRTGAVYLLDIDGNLRWRVEREGAEIGGLVSDLEHLFVVLHDQEGAEVLRLPR